MDSTYLLWILLFHADAFMLPFWIHFRCNGLLWFNPLYVALDFNLGLLGYFLYLWRAFWTICYGQDICMDLRSEHYNPHKAQCLISLYAHCYLLALDKKGIVLNIHDHIYFNISKFDTWLLLNTWCYTYLLNGSLQWRLTYLCVIAFWSTSFTFS